MRRVVEPARVFQRSNNLPDALVHTVDHGGIDLHEGAFPVLIFGVFPGRRLDVARRHRPRGIDEAELLDSLVAGVANRVPAAIVDAVVLFEVVGPGMHGPMGGREGDVHEERLIAVVLRMVANELGRVLADSIGVEEVGRVGRDQFVVPRERVGIVEAAGSVDRSKEAVEATLQRPVELLVIAARLRLFGDVPFACHVRAVASQTHRFARW